tara:strand:- start:143 stop:718 length:576 start_codon:yes stop_codon:yes gene_type:complete
MGKSQYDPDYLFRVYNQETAQFQVYGNNKRLDPDTRDDLRLFGLFCRRHSVDPALWIRARHSAIKWVRKIKVGTLSSTKFLDSYRAFAEDKAASQIGEETLAEAVIDDTAGSYRDTTLPHEEAFKAAMHRVGAYDACLGSSGYMTGGFNPKSSWCSMCSVANECGRHKRNRNVRSGRIRPRLSEGADSCVY